MPLLQINKLYLKVMLARMMSCVLPNSAWPLHAQANHCQRVNQTRIGREPQQIAENNALQDTDCKNTS